MCKETNVSGFSVILSEVYLEFMVLFNTCVKPSQKFKSLLAWQESHLAAFIVLFQVLLRCQTSMIQFFY